MNTGKKSHARILLVDDDEFIRKTICTFLKLEGYVVDVAEDGRGMARQLAASVPDLMLLDVGLPEEDGFSLVQKVRRDFADLPIIFLTGKGDPMDKVLGLELGANDYVTKPFHNRELLARIRSLIRSKAIANEGARTERFEFGAFVLDTKAMTLRHRDDGNISLTSREYRLLKILVENEGRVLSRDRLLDLTAGRHGDPNDRSIDMLVVKLRRKLEGGGKNPEFIKTIRGEGYVFTRSG